MQEHNTRLFVWDLLLDKGFIKYYVSSQVIQAKRNQQRDLSVP